MRIKKISIHSAWIAAFSMMLLTLSAPVAIADVFPAAPFNGLQVSYSVSGATLATPKDSEGFTLSRSVGGTLTGSELTVSGVARAMYGWGATIDVSVMVDGEEAKTFHEEKFPEGGLLPSGKVADPMSQPFTVTVPIPADAESASFSIRLAGSFNAGHRGVVVEGTLDRSAPQSDPQDRYEAVEAGIPDPRFKPRPSKELKLYKILQLYEQRIPKGITSSGNKNNLLSVLPYYGDEYDEFKCGGYQGKVLHLLDSLRFSDDPEERALLDEWDYGPIEALWGGHQAVVIYPKGTDWTDSGIVLDPWIDQEPKTYGIHQWSGIFSPENVGTSISGYAGGPISDPLEAGSFYGIGGSSVYEGTPEYPTVGGDYVDPKDKKLTKAEMDYGRNLPEETKDKLNRLTEHQRRVWIKTKMAEENKNGRAVGFSPVNLYLEDEDGKITGFPGSVPTAEIEEISMRRLPLGDGTYWTELEYPQNRSYYLMAEGTDEGKADIFMVYGMGVSEARSVYRYQMDVSSGEIFAALPDYRGGILYSSSSGSISPEEIETIDRSWLDSKPEIVAPPEYEIDIEDEEIFSSSNIYAVSSNPTAPATFSIDSPLLVTFVMDYHYQNQGKPPGTIALRHDDGTVYGPWDAVGREAQGGVNNAYWEVWPYAFIKPGSYTIIDSDPETWSQNLASEGRGISVVRGVYVTEDPSALDESAIEPSTRDPEDGDGATGAEAQEFVQWAVAATASSEYSSTGWSALQATGEPDTYPDHGDITTAWASLEEDDGIQWLDLEHEVPVWITRVEIYETYNPGAIIGLEIYDQDGGRHHAWEGSMEPATEARISAIDIDADFPSDRIRIILDTRRVSGWNEIDAVALIGTRSLPQSDLWSYGDVLVDAPPGGWEGVEPGEAI
jgi:hypothetical protein